MAKKVMAVVKLQAPAGKATPSPPVGPALGQHGVNLMEFCKAFNAITGGKGQDGMVTPVVITIHTDRSFTFITKTAPAAILLKKAAQIAKGSSSQKSEKVGKVSARDVREIAQLKMKDLNASSVEAAMRTIMGTARSMGIEVVE